MTDRIPPYIKNVDRAVANAARAQDIAHREKIARPHVAGRDYLDAPNHRRPVDGMDERFGFPGDSHYLKD